MYSSDGWLRPCEAGACVEVKVTPDGQVLVRSSVNRWKEALLSKKEWLQFLQDCKDAKFDILEATNDL